jgi:hypothetical protein
VRVVHQDQEVLPCFDRFQSSGNADQCGDAPDDGGVGDPHRPGRGQRRQAVRDVEHAQEVRPDLERADA